MYKDFYNFDAEPFSLTPDPRFIYPAPGHQEAFEHMVYGVREKKGFILITGTIGTGKTTLTRRLLDKLEDKVSLALIFNTYLNETELLKAIIHEFGQTSESASRADLIHILNGFLIENLRAGGNAVLIIDEAQNLSVSVLEQIRMLSNLETDNEKLIQIILVGQPELNRTLSRSDLAQLDQRITVRYHLSPLNFEDTVQYVHHRLMVAGPKTKVGFESRSYGPIFRYSKGVPRRINALCDRALLIAYAKGVYLVGPDFVHQAQHELIGGERPTWRGWIKKIRPGFMRATGMILFLMVTFRTYLAAKGFL